MDTTTYAVPGVDGLTHDGKVVQYRRLTDETLMKYIDEAEKRVNPKEIFVAVTIPDIETGEFRVAVGANILLDNGRKAISVAGIIDKTPETTGVAGEIRFKY